MTAILLVQARLIAGLAVASYVWRRRALDARMSASVLAHILHTQAREALLAEAERRRWQERARWN